MNKSHQTSSDNHLRSRAIAGVTVFVVFMGITVVFSTLRAMAIFALYQKGLRHDVIALLIARDLSLAIVILSAGFLLWSLIQNLGKLGRVIAAIVLILAVCSAGISVSAEQRMHSRIQNNLEQLRRAMENYCLQKGPSGSRAVRTP